MKGHKPYYKKPMKYDAISEFYKAYGNFPRERLYELFKPRFSEKELKPLIEGTILECPFCGGIMKKHAGNAIEFSEFNGGEAYKITIKSDRLGVPTERNYYCEKCITIVSPTGKLLVRAGKVLLPVVDE